MQKQETSAQGRPGRAEERLLLLGRDHAVYGAYQCVALAGARTAGAISVGSDRRSPSLWAKRSAAVPNEDALLAIERGDRVLLAVADAHFGWQASHELLTAIFDAVEDLPSLPRDLEHLITHLPPAGEPMGSWTTLVLAVYDRRAHQGFGLSFGDSSLVLAGPDTARTVNVRNSHFVDPRVPESLDPTQAFAFSFLAPREFLLVAYTDGVNECHYRSPDTSITLSHLAQLLAHVGPAPEAYAQQLVRTALAGVDGNPGGQDNVALVVTAA